MASDKALGKILWWSARDENGILIDPMGNEYYFDRSVILSNQYSKLINNSIVLFTPSRCDGVLVAKKVTLPRASSIAKYLDQFNQASLQLYFS